MRFLSSPGGSKKRHVVETAAISMNCVRRLRDSVSDVSCQVVWKPYGKPAPLLCTVCSGDGARKKMTKGKVWGEVRFMCSRGQSCERTNVTAYGFETGRQGCRAVHSLPITAILAYLPTFSALSPSPPP